MTPSTRTDIAHGLAADRTLGLLGVLQYCDSLFPSGASAFSWGLESLHVDNMVAGFGDVGAVLQALIAGRWAGFDRPLLLAAYHAADDLGPLRDIDRLAEAMTLNQGARTASCRLGFTQLRVHAELGLADAAHYLDEVRAGRAPGHLPVVQGLVWRALGVAPGDALTMSAFGLCVSIVGAGMRLGLLGHIDAQRVLSGARESIESVMSTAVPSLDDLWTATPVLDVAAMRHEPRTARLFAS